MYELYKIEENLYQIHSKNFGQQSMEGTLLAVLTYAVYSLGFQTSELELALLDMNDLDYDGAYFGINRSFIYSFDRKNKKVG